MAATLSPNFSSHLCSVEVCDVRYNIRILKMKESVFIYIGEQNAETFDELAMAMAGLGDSKETMSTSIMGAPVGCGSEELAQKLAKKLRKQVYLSANVPNDRIVRPTIEQKLFEEINNNLECF
ncbi:proteasome assembly chaperone 4-like [Uranotaenia lowii]|uniref:proteasome assembly chaperone 4-like n=1 Tax=Uranotaenia lowii TaxID=190385 RepID=UPI0024798E39|nr:proteasome assembly chaperone 4-like [Uranotaenia lowii]